MGKIIETKINSFDGGLSNDLRVNSANKYALLRNFDPFTYKHKLVPRGNVTAKETKALNIVKLLYAPRASYGNYIFGLGIKAGGYLPAVYYFDEATGWQAPANNEGASGARSEDVFFSYKGYAYLWGGGNALKRFDLDSGDAFNDTYQSLNYTTVVQPIHHKSDDCAYFFNDHYVHRLNDTVFDGGTDTIPLTLPDDGYITAACSYGNFIAIAWTADDGLRNTVFLWDRNATLNTISERYDYGAGKIIHLADLGGRLTAVVESYPKLLIKQLYGGTLEVISELVSNAIGGFLPAKKTNLVIDNKLYFPFDLDADGGDRLGVYVVRSDGSISMDYAIDDATTYKDIFTDGSYMWFAHSNDGSVDRISLSSTLNTETAIYESLIFGERGKYYKLNSVEVTMSPTTGDVTLKYRKKESDSWVEIFTHTTNYSYGHQTVAFETASTGVSIGDTLPNFNEIQFRVEAVSGAIITGLNFKAEEIDAKPN